MSGDVQPRKRKDRKRKKDELGLEEPRGTAAVLGEGDVFMHSQHEHGTGGHWCAKIIFFSLLAILITLIGLIILENRGLTELEANAVESRYSGVFQGWIEDDNHHDEHTLDLKHHDDDDGEADQNENNLSNELEHDTEDNNEADDQINEENEDDDSDLNEDNDLNEDDDEEENNLNEADDEEENNLNEDDDEEDNNHNIDGENNNEDDEEEGEKDNDDGNASEEDSELDEFDNVNYKYSLEDDDSKEHVLSYKKSTKNVEENDEDEFETYTNNDYFEYDEDDGNENKRKLNDNEEENDDQSKQVEDFKNDESENDRKESSDEDLEHRDQYENEDSNYKNVIGHTRRDIESDEDFVMDERDSDVEVEKIEKEYSDEELAEPVMVEHVTPIEKGLRELENSNEKISEEDEDDKVFLAPEDIEEPPVVESITAPRGKPLIELEDEASSEKPPNTLAEEEEYEKQQEELSRQKEQASHMWLKVLVGGALVVATHAVLRRATAPRDTLASEGQFIREETPSLIDRRMTLILEETLPVNPKLNEETSQTFIPDAMEHIAFLTNTTPILNQEIEKKEESPVVVKEFTPVEMIKDEEEDKELYSEEDDEDVQEEVFEEKTEPTKLSSIETKAESAPESDQEDVSDDVEIIDDEQLEEELIDEDEEEISDVDDSELLRRLEAKYGRLPEPERPGTKPKDGGNSIVDEWPGEPSEAYWRQYLDQAEQDFQQGEWSAAEERAGAAALRGSARARYVRARALDAAAEARRDNALLTKAIAAYLELLKMNDRLSDHRLKEISERTLDRIRFRGNYMGAEPVYRLLINRFPNDPSYRNNLSISFLMANRPDLAEDVLKETLQLWPNDRVALAHLGFVLKNRHNRLEEAVDLFQKALEGDIGPANEPRFYYHLGDALLLLGRYEEAHQVHVRGAKLGHFLSHSQRSLYNVERLKSRPWWNIEQTPYWKLARSLEKSWREILKEGNAARAVYEEEKEGLKERGEWSQLDLFVRGQEIPDRCKRAPVTCSIVRQETAAAGCRRGQIKFSMMEAGTHVRPHVGPTNCRLRMHLGLSNTKDTFIRVDKEIRQWDTGKVLMFDDSFEHEVWHNGTGTRLVLIVDVWHPDLTPAERKQLPSI